PADVVNCDEVGPTLGVYVDLLDAIEVHRDGPDIACEANARAIGKCVHGLVDGRPVENHRVVSILAFDNIAAITRSPLEYVIAAAEVGGVVAWIAVDEVISVAPEQGVVAVAAEDGVVAGPAVNGKLDQRGQIAAGGEVVIAAIHVDDEVFAGT